MIGLLMGGLLVGYALVYSGMSDLAGNPISALQAITGPPADKGKGSGKVAPGGSGRPSSRAPSTRQGAHP